MRPSCKIAANTCEDGVVFSVRVSDDIHFHFEEVALVGDHPALGAWHSQKAILMDRCDDDPKIWVTKVRLQPGIVVQYRYFITAVDCEASENGHGAKQIRRWESSTNPRSYQVKLGVPKPTETFGNTGAGKFGRKEVALGWLNFSRIVQFVIQPMAIKITDKRYKDLTFNIKIQPINLCTKQAMSDMAHVSTEYINLACGGSCWRPQPSIGVSYDPEALYYFQTRVYSLRDIAFELQLITPGYEQKQEPPFGVQRINPALFEKSVGKFKLKIISNKFFIPIGTANVEFLVIAPSSRNNFEFIPATRRMRWMQTDECLDVGHRGLGRSICVRNRSPIPENTLGSIQAAINCGVDMVEFDVVVTKDLIPVVFHDLSILVCKDELARPKVRSDLTEVYIDTLTYAELTNLKTYYVVNGQMRKFFARSSILKESNRDVALFPTLQEVLERIDPSVGFDLDIKWPQVSASGRCDGYNGLDKNLFVDCILSVIHRYRRNRFMIIGCFDASLSAMFRLKQNIYPVMVLVSNFLKQSCRGPEYADAATQTVLSSIDYAQAFDLAAIAPNAFWIAYDSRLIRCAHQLGLKVLAWGDVLSDDRAIRNHKMLGLDAVIYDRADLWCTKRKPRKRYTLS